MLFAWNISYQGLYDLGYSLHNPFGDRRLDVAHEVIGGGIAKLSAAIARVDGHLPPHLTGAAKDEEDTRSHGSIGEAMTSLELVDGGRLSTHLRALEVEVEVTGEVSTDEATAVQDGRWFQRVFEAIEV